MKVKNIFMISMLGACLLLGCKKEEKAEFATFRYSLLVDGEKSDVNYVSEEKNCTFIGYSISTNGDTLSFFRQIDGCFSPISIDTEESYSSLNDKQMHFEGGQTSGLEMFIGGGDNYPAPKFISGKVDLLHSDEEYIEGTFTGAFFREYVFVDGDHSNWERVKDTIRVEDGYFKVSISESYDRIVYQYE